MGSKGPEEHCNTETEEGTIAFQKKRSRRVSFAEITSVHVFDRDEEYGTSSDSKPSSGDPELGKSNENLSFLRDFTDGGHFKDSSRSGEDYDDDDELDERRSFLRPMESPSPGSTIGSATSNDDDNFFGPVSSSFIRPRRLSDSAASDENYDVTMDSTAFSMHFRSLARSDSGGDLKTPTGADLSFVKKTPTQTTMRSDLGSSMILTVDKEPIAHSYMGIAKLHCSGDSNDMSLIEERPRSYDYGRLSPRLNALLDGGSKNLYPVSNSDDIVSKSPIKSESKFSPSKKSESGLGEQHYDSDKDTSHDDTNDTSVQAISIAAHGELGKVDFSSKPSPIRQITCNVSSSACKTSAAGAPFDPRSWSPNRLSKGKESAKDASGTRRPYSELSSVNGGNLTNLDSGVLQLDVHVRSECDSPLVGSIPLLSAKQRQTFVHTVSPPKYPCSVTPSHNHIIVDGSRKHGESTSAILKSISKLNMLEGSSFSSTFRAKIDSELISSNLFKTPPFDTACEKNHKDVQVKHVGASVDCFEETLSRVAQRNGEHKFVVNMDGNNIDVLEEKEELSIAPAKDGKPQNHKYKGANISVKGSPSQLIWSGMKTWVTSKDPLEGTLFTSGTGSSSTDMILDCIHDEKSISTPHEPISSSGTKTESKSVTSPEHKRHLSGTLSLDDHYNNLILSRPGQDADSSENTTNARIGNKLDLLFTERAQSRSTFIGLDHPEDFTELEMTNDRSIKIQGVQDEPRAIRNFQTPTDSENCQSTTLDGNLQTETDALTSTEVISGRGLKASYGGSESPFSCRSVKETSLQKNLEECFSQSLSKKEPCNVNDSTHSFPMEDMRYSNSNQMEDGFGNISVRKRTRENMILSDRDHLDETASVQRTPKIHKGQGSDAELVLEHPTKGSNETSTIVHDTKLEHWTDVFSKFSGDTKKLLSPLIDKLNLQAMGVLEDILVHLQQLKTYEMLCSDIQSQKAFDHLSNLRHKRMAETWLLLQRIVHEHAKLQVMLVKREMLQRKIRLVSLGIQQSEMLKLNSLPCLSLIRQRDAQVNTSLLQSLSVDLRGAQEVVSDEVNAMRQVLEASDREITNLTKSFHIYCKMKGEPNYADTIVLVNDHLKRRTSCRLLCLDLQLWEIVDLKCRDGQHNIVLNYLGFAIQRFTVNVSPVSSIIVSNKLNDADIKKNFPDMDASVAFAFVLNVDTTQKYGGHRSLLQETQMTTSLLGNLLDVIEEVQLSRVALQNLVRTSFDSSSAEQLDLQLCFIDFEGSRKVVLTLDMSCLNRGIYPSECIPSELEAPTDVTEKSLPQPLLDEIRAAVQRERVGYLRITRLCRCVSRAVQAWGE